MTDEELDEAIGMIDELLLNGRFSTVDRWLAEFDVLGAEVILLIVIMGATLAAASDLHERNGFVERVEQRLVEEEPHRVDRLMDGLR